MRSPKILYLFSISFLFLASCKKDNASDSPNASQITVGENGNVSVGADASGALYTIYSRAYLEPTGNGRDDDELAMAWFGSATDMKDAGVVTVNTQAIENAGMGANFYFSNGDPFLSGNNVSWTVSGNPAAGITGFNHTDNAAFPAGGDFELPSSIDISKSLTISHTTTTGIAVYAISGTKGTKTKVYQGSASSVTFTPAELMEVADSKDDIYITIMPVSYSDATYNGKKYYFVKQYATTRFTETQ